MLKFIDNEATEIGVTLLIEIHKIVSTNPDISSPAIVERFRDQENFRFLEKLAVWDHLVDETNLKSFYEETIDTVEERMVNSCINVLLGRSATSELDGISKAKLSSLYARRETLRSKRGRT